MLRNTWGMMWRAVSSEVTASVSAERNHVQDELGTSASYGAGGGEGGLVADLRSACSKTSSYGTNPVGGI